MSFFSSTFSGSELAFKEYQSLRKKYDIEIQCRSKAEKYASQVGEQYVLLRYHGYSQAIVCFFHLSVNHKGNILDTTHFSKKIRMNCCNL